MKENQRHERRSVRPGPGPLRETRRDKSRLLTERRRFHGESQVAYGSSWTNFYNRPRLFLGERKTKQGPDRGRISSPKDQLGCSTSDIDEDGSTFPEDRTLTPPTPRETIHQAWHYLLPVSLADLCRTIALECEGPNLGRRIVDEFTHRSVNCRTAELKE